MSKVAVKGKAGMHLATVLLIIWVAAEMRDAPEQLQEGGGGSSSQTVFAVGTPWPRAGKPGFFLSLLVLVYLWHFLLGMCIRKNM